MGVSEPMDASLVRIRVSAIGLDCASVNLLGYLDHPHPAPLGLELLRRRSELDGCTYAFR